MLLENNTQFTTRHEFELSLIEPNAPQDYSFDEYLANSLDIATIGKSETEYKSEIIDVLIAMIDDIQKELK